MEKLDLGCGIIKRDGAIGVDCVSNSVVNIIHDLNKFSYPFENNKFEDVLLDNSLEYLDNIILTIEEIWRITKNKGLVTIKVPYFKSHYAIDPTHRHYFVSHSFFYFDPKHLFNKFYKYSDVTLK